MLNSQLNALMPRDLAFVPSPQHLDQDEEKDTNTKSDDKAPAECN